jgi:hypothetical protein
MEKRRSDRTKHRLTCELLVGRQVFPAVVRDLAPTGLFVQTRARPEANSVIEVRFPPTADLPGFRIEAGVARHRNVHPRLQAEVHAGVGLEILGRPKHYLALADRVGGLRVDERGRGTLGATVATARPPEPELRRYRVRLLSHGRPQPRTLEILASSIATARALAMSQAGAGWKITDIQTI